MFVPTLYYAWPGVSDREKEELCSKHSAQINIILVNKL